MAELGFPPIYLLPTHIEPEELAALQGQIHTLTYDINEAEVVLGKISRRERAIFELRRRGIITTEIASGAQDASHSHPKRRKLEASQQEPGARSDVASDIDGQGSASTFETGPRGSVANKEPGAVDDIVQVVKLAWFTNSVSGGTVLPIDKYLVYQGFKQLAPGPNKQLPNVTDILRRARDGESGRSQQTQALRRGYASGAKHPRTLPSTKQLLFTEETTSDCDVNSSLPPIPQYLHTTYSCERPTPANPPNKGFIEELKKIRTTRALAGDKTGVRAYSTSIATLSAYPHLLTDPREVSRLPGCGPKIADLFHEWSNTGHIREVNEADADAHLAVLHLFYGVWGVAETTAREFYKKGWRELDDIVEFGWESLTRVQQIGVKYYDEFLSEIPRGEVEEIGRAILAHANRRCQGFQMTIVGGYRRGKQMSGDVDVVLSHPDTNATRDFIEELVTRLEKDEFITHTLMLDTNNSERDQAPLPWKGEDRGAAAGFDTLDKAMVVWQNPVWDKSIGTRNPNPHRRVDIIISPWRTVGCAVVGWSGGTTFQRDLRRYCKYVKSLKFDSSGIRSRIDGHWVDLESANGHPAPDMLTAERRVFSGLGLEWRPPEERCTG